VSGVTNRFRSPQASGSRARGSSALAPAGVNAALDLAGSGVIAALIELVGEPSRVLSISDFAASRSGAQGSFAPQKNPERALEEAARHFSEGAFRVTLEKTFPLAQAAEAFGPPLDAASNAARACWRHDSGAPTLPGEHAPEAPPGTPPARS